MTRPSLAPHRARPFGVRRAFLCTVVLSLGEETDVSQHQLPLPGGREQPLGNSQLDGRLPGSVAPAHPIPVQIVGGEIHAATRLRSGIATLSKWVESGVDTCFGSAWAAFSARYAFPLPAYLKWGSAQWQNHDTKSRLLWVRVLDSAPLSPGFFSARACVSPSQLAIPKSSRPYAGRPARSLSPVTSSTPIR